MSMLSAQSDELRKMAAAMSERGSAIGLDYGVGRGLVDAARMMREAADTIESLRYGLQKEGDALRAYRASQIAAEAERRLHGSYGQVPEQAKRENGADRESCGEVCGDDRFELIDKAKRKLLECTNIESRPEEVAVLDNILFRCWQMGWLDQLRENRYADLFGTPERAARTIAGIKCDDGGCEGCTLYGAECSYDSDVLLGWLRGDA